MNRLCKAVQFAHRETRLRRNPVECEGAHEGSEERETRGVAVNKCTVDPAVLNEQIGNAVEQNKVRFGP